MIYFRIQSNCITSTLATIICKKSTLMCLEGGGNQKYQSIKLKNNNIGKIHVSDDNYNVGMLYLSFYSLQDISPLNKLKNIFSMKASDNYNSILLIRRISLSKTLPPKRCGTTIYSQSRKFKLKRSKMIWNFMFFSLFPSSFTEEQKRRKPKSYQQQTLSVAYPKIWPYTLEHLDLSVTQH
jgi:hypothetical protein